MKEKNLWTVVYETVNEKTHRTVRHFAARNVDWKTACMVKRNHKKICAMTIYPARAFEILNSIPRVEGEIRTVEKCGDCGHLFGRRYIPFGIGKGATFDPCLCQVTGHRPSKTILESQP